MKKVMEKKETIDLKKFAHSLNNVIFELEKNGMAVEGKKLVISQGTFDALFIIDDKVPKKKVQPKKSENNVRKQILKPKSVETLEEYYGKKEKKV